MKTIFNQSDFDELYRRADAIRPDASHQWGKMDVAQMLSHLTTSIDVALGTIRPQSEANFLTRWIIRPIALSSLPIKRNSPSASVFKEHLENRDFATEKQRLLEGLHAAAANGADGIWFDHIAFGPLNSEEWGD